MGYLWWFMVEVWREDAGRRAAGTWARWDGAAARAPGGVTAGRAGGGGPPPGPGGHGQERAATRARADLGHRVVAAVQHDPS